MATTVASLALLLFGSTRAIAVIVVDPNATPCVATYSAHYTTIQAAVTAAGSGATIDVCPGTHAEQVTIGTPLTLRGVTNTAGNAGASVVTIPNGTFTSGFTQIMIEATGVSLDSIGVDGTNTVSGCSSEALTGILLETGSSGTLKQVALRNHNISYDSGGYCGTGTPVSASSATSVTVRDSSVRNFDGTGIYLSATTTAVVKTSTVAPISPAPTSIYASAATVQITSNSMTNCAYGVYVTSTVLGTVSGNTVAGGSSGAVGIFCFPVCTGLTISGNQIFDTGSGVSMKTSGEVGGASSLRTTIFRVQRMAFTFPSA